MSWIKDIGEEAGFLNSEVLTPVNYGTWDEPDWRWGGKREGFRREVKVWFLLV